MNINLYVITGLFCGLLFSANAAENLLKDAAIADKDKPAWDAVAVKPGAGKQGGACFEQQGRYIHCKKLIPVDAAKTYKVSVWVKNPTDKELTVLLGMRYFDQDKRIVKENEVFFEAGTDTELTNDCLATDTVVKVKDASNWKITPYPVRMIAFKTQADCKDLPNRNLSSSTEKIEKKDDHWEVTLKEPVGSAFPAGTPIRQHKLISHDYASYEKIAAGANWSQVSGNPLKNWYPGTVYCSIMIVVQGGDTGLLLDDIRFETVE